MSSFRTTPMTVAMTTLGFGFCLAAEPIKEVMDVSIDQNLTQTNPGEQAPRKLRTELSDLIKKLQKEGKICPNEVTSTEVLVWEGKVHANPGEPNAKTTVTALSTDCSTHKMHSENATYTNIIQLIKEGKVEPTPEAIYVMNSDGTFELAHADDTPACYSGCYLF